jgi:CheY-like chemotaxis protein
MERELHALIVDQSTLTRKTIMSSLAETGLARFRFTEAADGPEALERFRPGTVDLLFVDITMPRLDGVAFLRQLRSLGSDCPPIILITPERSREKLMNAVSGFGVDAFLVKPVEVERLRASLRPLVASIPLRGGPWTVPFGECVSEALQLTLERGCRIALAPDRDASMIQTGDVLYGMLDVFGDVRWSVQLSFERAAAESVASALAGYPIRFDDAELADAIGEITNMVGGQLRRLLAGKGLRVDCSFPTVMAATGLRFLISRGSPSTADHAGFSMPAGKIAVGVRTALMPAFVL